MDIKEIFGEELSGKIEEIIKTKGLTLILDDSKKPGYIPKSRFDELIGQKNELKSQVSEINNQLIELKKTSAGNEELTKKLQELEKNNSEWEKKFQKAQIESGIKIKAISEKACDPSDLIKFVDVNKIKFDNNGEVIGIEEQIAELKKSKSYLFTSAEIPSKPGTNPASGPSLPKKATVELYKEAMALAQKNPNDQGLRLQLFKLKEQLISEKK